jgi:hypothetical protein
MGAPIAVDLFHGLTVEGAIQHAVIRLEAGVPSDVFGGIPHDLFVNIPIPIADVSIGGWDIAQASWARFAPVAIEATRFVRSRAQVEGLALDRVHVAGGEYKSTSIPKSTVVSPFIDFFVVGDSERLELILRHVTELSAGRAGGLGAVVGWEVGPDPDERALVFRDAPQRAIPLTREGGPWDVGSFAAGSYEVRHVATRAPYWHRRSYTECILPLRPL